MKTQELLNKLKSTAASNAKAVAVPFPPCADVMLSRQRNPPDETSPDIDNFFHQYFKIGHHVIFDDPSKIGIHKAAGQSDLFMQCLTARGKPIGFPPEACLPSSCITLGGTRGTFGGTFPCIFAGDIVWLFFLERMGIFKMLGAILDDFVTRGKYPFPNDDLNALILEAMVRQTKSGLSSTVRDRDAGYRRSLGWTSDVGRKLALPSRLNTGFNLHFHKFLNLALTWYNDRRLAQAIQSANNIRKSVATLTAISETLKDLRATFDEFRHGRNYSHTLSGIVWSVSGLTMIRDLRILLGITNPSLDPSQYIPAAYDLLIKNVPAGATDQSHYTQHIACASNGRDILIDLEFLDVTNVNDGPTDTDRGDLTVWLDLVESKIERYRTAYQGLTGVDLGAPGTPTIEQQA